MDDVGGCIDEDGEDPVAVDGDEAPDSRSLDMVERSHTETDCPMA